MDPMIYFDLLERWVSNISVTSRLNIIPLRDDPIIDSICYMKNSLQKMMSYLTKRIIYAE